MELRKEIQAKKLRNSAALIVGIRPEQLEVLSWVLH